MSVNRETGHSLTYGDPHSGIHCRWEVRVNLKAKSSTTSRPPRVRSGLLQSSKEASHILVGRWGHRKRDGIPQHECLVGSEQGSRPGGPGHGPVGPSPEHTPMVQRGPSVGLTVPQPKHQHCNARGLPQRTTSRRPAAGRNRGNVRHLSQRMLLEKAESVCHSSLVHICWTKAIK